MQGFASGGGGDTDLAHLQSTMHAIELACSSIQVPMNFLLNLLDVIGCSGGFGNLPSFLSKGGRDEALKAK